MFARETEYKNKTCD